MGGSVILGKKSKVKSQGHQNKYGQNAEPYISTAPCRVLSSFVE